MCRNPEINNKVCILGLPARRKVRKTTMLIPNHMLACSCQKFGLNCRVINLPKSSKLKHNYLYANGKMTALLYIYIYPSPTYASARLTHCVYPYTPIKQYVSPGCRMVANAIGPTPAPRSSATMWATNPRRASTDGARCIGRDAETSTGSTTTGNMRGG